MNYPYDIETYPNIFTLCIKRAGDYPPVIFEISTRIDQRREMINYISNLDGRMVGYNNIGFDYPVVHYIITNPHATVRQIYDKAMSIIFGDRFANIVWESDWVKPQVDLFKIHHFDNVNRATSLKLLEFNMRSESIQDLPFDVGLELTPPQMDVLREYNVKDVIETEKFLHISHDRIAFREELTERYGKNFLNHNDTKIGKDYFIMQLGDDLCYTRESGRREPRQTRRPYIHMRDVIFPYIKFEQPEFQRIHQWLLQQTIYETKGVFSGLTATIDGFTYVFGVGGIHGSIESAIVRSDDEYVIDDRDVASYYPNIAIANNVFPEHLGQQFCTIYKDVYEQRKAAKAAKQEAVQQMLKLALNGVYGDSNNEYSPFYDPQYTMKITVNGQLLLCMLAEQLLKVPGLTMIQINTDGLTTRYPRQHATMVDSICKWWESFTLLTLESVKYSMMAIKNVNAYLAVTESGKVKRKKEYCTIGAHTLRKDADLDWHQPHSALVVAMAAEACLLLGLPVRDFILNHDDIMDFMLVVKVPRASSLEIDGVKVQNITRYYVSTNGGFMFKIMPPVSTKYVWTLRNPTTGKTKEVKSEKGVASNAEKGFTEVLSKVELPAADRNMAICKGWKVTECNDMRGRMIDDINYEYYIQEAEKLVNPLINGL